MSRFNGRTGVVTGGLSGIGAETARRFAADRATVSVADIDTNGAATAVAGIESAGPDLASSGVQANALPPIASRMGETRMNYGGEAAQDRAGPRWKRYVPSRFNAPIAVHLRIDLLGHGQPGGPSVEMSPGPLNDVKRAFARPLPARRQPLGLTRAEGAVPA